ncbi:MAG TPA: hypothetical protein VFF06_37415 [Polyangia bacterium]|nr:hypothetical protein [Polyangia bacterium]
MPDDNSEAAPADPGRLRISLWAGTPLITPANLAGADRILDDLSILSTLVNDAVTKPGLNIVEDRKLPHGAGWGDVIHACHEKKIQCFAGYDLAASPHIGARFNDWLNELDNGSFAGDPDVEIARVAGSVVGFLGKSFPVAATSGTTSFDGISFDIETIRDPAKDALMIDFYQEIAEQLESAQPGGGRVLGVASGGLVDDDSATDKGTHVALASVKAQPYKMANASPPHSSVSNLLLRPMCYDAFGITLDDPRTGLFHRTQGPTRVTRWHNEIMDYAMAKPMGPNAAGVSESQFQLGIKMFAGSNNRPQPVDAAGAPVPNASDPRFDHFVVSSFATDGYMDDDVEIRQRCRELRKRGLGLCIFAMFTGGLPAFWQRIATFNWVLNAKVPPPAAFDRDPTPNGDPAFNPAQPWVGTVEPGTLAQPRQVPHTALSIARLAT